MKKMLIICAVIIISIGNLQAQTTYSYGAGLAPIAYGIGTDSERYLNNGSWQNDQSASYFELNLDLSLFGTFTIDEIDYIKYVTKKTTDGTKPDFFLKIYTPNTGGPNYYGYRINAEPYFSNNLSGPGNQWNEWNTSATSNELTFFDSNVPGVGFGFYGQPTLANMQAGSIDWNSYNASAAVTSIDYGAENVWIMALGTGTEWNKTFSGFLDQIIVSVNGTVVIWDLEGGLSEVWVDDDWAGSSIGTPVDGHIFGNDAFATIQDGIDAVTGSTVNVAAGTYLENIVIDKPLTLIGAGSTNTIIDASGTTNDYGILLTTGGTSATQRLSITGMTIKNSSSHGIKAYKGGGLNFDYVTFDDLLLTLNGANGVELHNGTIVSDMIITNCEFSGNTGRGLRASSATPINGLLIDGCTLDNNEFGVYLAAEYSNVTVTNTTMNNNVKRGWYGCDVGVVRNIEFENCEANNNGRRGITIWAYDVGGIDGVNIKNTEIIGNLQRGFHIGAATSWAENEPSPVKNVLMENCSVLNNGLGVESDRAGFHIDIGDLTNVKVRYCNISGNMDYGVYNADTYSAGESVDALCNWWGATDGPSGSGGGSGDAVTDYVTYLPWLVGPAPDGSCTGPDPCAALDKLIEDLEGMDIHNGTKNSLNSKLTMAKKSCGKGKFKTASNLLQSFINECEAQSGKKLTVGQADDLIEQAGNIINGFNNVSPSINTADNDISITNIEEFTLIQNYPNPFNPTTSIKYRLPMNVHVSVQIYDILGQLVATLVNSEQSAGLHEVVWNGTNARGELVPSGTYISRVKTDNEVKTINMMYLK